MIPSIVDESHYEDVKTFFKNNYGIETKGYIQWAQKHTTDNQAEIALDQEIQEARKVTAS